MPRLPFLLIDAFAQHPFSGNSAGVVLPREALSDAQMQAIARAGNSSETSFVTGGDRPGPLRLRWFTPGCEVDFCGHATLAAAQAVHHWREAGLIARFGPAAASHVVEFDTRVGRLRLTGEELTASAENPLWWLEMPPANYAPANGANANTLAKALGTDLDFIDPRQPIVRTAFGQFIVFVADWNQLQALRPDFAALSAWCERNGGHGVLVSTTQTPTAAAAVASRFFAPVAGVNEDPVTGSVHGPLAAVLVDRGVVAAVEGVAAMNCLQGIPGDRGGLIRAMVDDRGPQRQVKIAGRCFITIAGAVKAPDSR